MSDGAVEVLGIDHVYITVRDLAPSERFYDSLLVGALGHVKARAPIGGDPHVHYINRHFSLALRPARAAVPHDPYAAGLHHFCFRVENEAAVDRVVAKLAAAGIAASAPRLYPEYAPDYYATFVEDPDGVRLEVTNFRAERRERYARLERGPQSWLALATSAGVVRRALLMSALVGALLIAINHGDALRRGELDRTRVLKMALTLLVPYCVSTYSSVGAMRPLRTPGEAP
jgi:catechol 2,3-dioxygenase-like lactoylglutathione lyase family enzyme